MNFRVNFYLKMVQQKSFVKLKWFHLVFFECFNLTIFYVKISHA